MAVDLLNLPSLRVTELDDGAVSGKGFVTVKAVVVGDTTHCPHCLGVRIHGHGVEERKVADTPLFGKPTKLVVQRKRFKCLDCDKTFSEPTPDLHDTRQATKRLVKFVQENGLRLTMAEVARQTGLANKTIRLFVDDYRNTEEKLRMPVTPRVLGLDEAMIGGVYRAVITNVESNDFFEILEGRTRQHLDAYFNPMPDKHRVEAVVTDLWNHYRATIQHHFPGIPQIADRFHVMRMASDAMENARKSVRQTLKAKQHEAERIMLKDRRFLLLGRQSELTAAEIVLLDEVKAKYPLLAAAHNAKEGFFALYDAPDRKTAEALFRQWKASIDPQVARWFTKVGVAVDDWHPQVFVYFDLAYTNAYTESFNRFIKDTNRFGRGYGFAVLRSRLLFNNITKHVEWPKIRGRATGGGAGSGTGAGAGTGAGRWGFTDSFMAPTVAAARVAMAPTPEHESNGQRYLWYGASIPKTCELLEAGYFE
ncbi:MAG: ISL3 family transposase [Candidatus Hydrogenedentes bacterium]|nr:ISL3 family transposase [Candidatus Hydrogenedentota bacterium]